jgi:hypothetical protein
VCKSAVVSDINAFEADAMTPRERLILFTRYPEPGTTKTRMIPCLGPQGAAELQRQMTVHVLSQATPLARLRKMELEVRYEGGSSQLMRTWLGDQTTFVHQGTGNIGERMARALLDAVTQGIDTAVLIGSDIPGISTTLLEDAFEKVNDRTVVLGPAKDGGYYLIGLSAQGHLKAVPGIFEGMPWGTSDVLQETCGRLRRKGLTYCLLDFLDDIDRPEDLAIWERFRRR